MNKNKCYADDQKPAGYLAFPLQKLHNYANERQLKLVHELFIEYAGYISHLYWHLVR